MTCDRDADIQAFLADLRASIIRAEQDRCEAINRESQYKGARKKALAVTAGEGSWRCVRTVERKTGKDYLIRRAYGKKRRPGVYTRLGEICLARWTYDGWSVLYGNLCGIVGAVTILQWEPTS